MRRPNLAMHTINMHPRYRDSFQSLVASSAKPPPAVTAMVSRRRTLSLLGVLSIAFGASGVAVAADTDQSKTAGGVTV